METLKIESLPGHVGIIMDGNGRWAKQKKFPRIYGHRNAISAVRQTVEASVELGIKILTLYAFSTENWERPKVEVNFLMKLFEEFLKKELKTLTENNIQFKILGHRSRLPAFLDNPIQHAYDVTKNNTGMTLCLAVDYGSRSEILNACKKIVKKVQSNQLNYDDIDEAIFSEHLFTNGLADPDLIIRTSGELRLSNFLLWQSAYAEFYFTDTLWPDFNRTELIKALVDYSGRNRRRGKVND